MSFEGFFSSETGHETRGAGEEHLHVVQLQRLSPVGRCRLTRG